MRSRNDSFEVGVFSAVGGSFLALSRTLDATLLFFLLFLSASTFSLALIHAFYLQE